MSYTFDQEWGSTFCSCCADGAKTWFCACLCPCIQFGWNSAQLQPGEAPCSGDCFAAGCSFCVLAYLIGMPCLVHMSTRTAIRRKYNLKAAPCNDFCVTWCCAPCALCQESYQLVGMHKGAAAKN